MEAQSLVLCDSNIIIDAMNGDEEVQRHLLELAQDDMLVSVITDMEIIKGAINKEMLHTFLKSLESYHTVHINEASSRKSAELIREYHLSHGLDIPDAMIAAIALTHDFELYTRNLKDFRFIEGLRLYKPRGD